MGTRRFDLRISLLQLSQAQHLVATFDPYFTAPSVLHSRTLYPANARYWRLLAVGGLRSCRIDNQVDSRQTVLANVGMGAAHVGPTG